MGKLKPEDIALNNKIAHRIKELRIKADPNQKRFAENNDLERQTLNRWGLWIWSYRHDTFRHDTLRSLRLQMWGFLDDDVLA